MLVCVCGVCVCVCVCVWVCTVFDTPVLIMTLLILEVGDDDSGCSAWWEAEFAAPISKLAVVIATHLLKKSDEITKLMDQSDSRLPHKKLRRDCDCVLPLCYEEGYEAGARARDYTSIYYDEFVEPPITKEMVRFHILLVERY